jgi:hypothetical protein
LSEHLLSSNYLTSVAAAAVLAAEPVLWGCPSPAPYLILSCIQIVGLFWLAKFFLLVSEVNGEILCPLQTWPSLPSIITSLFIAHTRQLKK